MITQPPPQVSYFGPQTVDIGKVHLREIRRGIFTRIEAGPAIRTVSADCSCTTAFFDQNGIYVDYAAPPSLPEYHRQQGATQFTTTKAVTVFYDDNTHENLYLTATVLAH
ncbi:hypothetical protein [Spirosoma sordidisoli]|uniref:DUF1573 domain-containing protein n=1 Tax=Spirosoma sordidisoli TaxID=2502893 RepID=A0A4Q2US24_9BACT|nr:hypothetical protein [Spirosoma sordidisoli]RYC70661.1 hypothetical protein EQG79_00485 [Spirosoma sordidisoli]